MSNSNPPKNPYASAINAGLSAGNEVARNAAKINYEVVRQVNKLLGRYRQAFPLPVDRMDLYRACMPQWIHDSTNSADLRSRLSVADWNLLASLPAVTTVHFRVSPRAAQLEDDELFWVRFETNIPAGSFTGLLVPSEFRRDINKWFKEARGADQDIHEAKKNVAAVANLVTTPAEMHMLWPDLARAVHVRVSSPGGGVKDARKLQQKFDAAVGPIDKRHTSDLLAKCLLLPDTQVTAWAGRQFGPPEASHA